jgi:hypothetical protein
MYSSLLVTVASQEQQQAGVLVVKGDAAALHGAWSAGVPVQQQQSTWPPGGHCSSSSASPAALINAGCCFTCFACSTSLSSWYLQVFTLAAVMPWSHCITVTIAINWPSQPGTECCSCLQ